MNLAFYAMHFQRAKLSIVAYMAITRQGSTKCHQTSTPPGIQISGSFDNSCAAQVTYLPHPSTWPFTLRPMDVSEFITDKRPIVKLLFPDSSQAGATPVVPKTSP
jgi:hypothetical protein